MYLKQIILLSLNEGTVSRVRKRGRSKVTLTKKKVFFEFKLLFALVLVFGVFRYLCKGIVC